MSQVVTILGCGSSGGVPRVAQGWGVCDPGNPRNRRRRCSILVEKTGSGGTTRVLIDTSPDLREQLIGAGVERLDAILMTHPHADHVHGIDDVRPLVLHMSRRLDIHMDEPTSRVVRNSFGYIFETPEGSNYPPLLNEARLRPGQVCRIDGAGGPLEFMPFRLDHGEIDALGFRVGNFAYTPDFVRVYPESWQYLEGLAIWVVDALRYTSHPTHLSIGEALEMIRMLRPGHSVMTNLSSEVDYEILRKDLPAGVEPAYDGMRLEI